MTRRPTAILLALCATALFGAAGCARDEIACGWTTIPARITVADAATKAPLVGARIIIDGAKTQDGRRLTEPLTTNADGEASLYVGGGWSREQRGLFATETFTWGGQRVRAQQPGYNDGISIVPKGRSNRKTWSRERPLVLFMYLSSDHDRSMQE